MFNIKFYMQLHSRFSYYLHYNKKEKRKSKKKKVNSTVQKTKKET